MYYTYTHTLLILYNTILYYMYVCLHVVDAVSHKQYITIIIHLMHLILLLLTASIGMCSMCSTSSRDSSYISSSMCNTSSRMCSGGCSSMYTMCRSMLYAPRLHDMLCYSGIRFIYIYTIRRVRIMRALRRKVRIMRVIDVE